MAKKVGDKLPKDLLEAGAFEDPSTSSTVHDQVAGITITEHVRDHMKGIKPSQEEEEEADEEDE